MFFASPHHHRTSYPTRLHSIINLTDARESWRGLRHWPGIGNVPTPLYNLPSLAKHFGISQLQVKDESVRSEVGSFKALGAPIAMARLLARLEPDQRITPAELLAGRCRDWASGFTVISATDGNHGRALAAAAHTVGCRCVIVLHAKVSSERETAIAGYGAEIVRIKGNYDDSVAEAARLATANGWHVVSDTSYSGYEEVPRDVMQGYGVIAVESIEQSGDAAEAPSFTHLLLQGGVGGFAAGVGGCFWDYYGPKRPTVIVVEPREADCLLQSARAGEPTPTGGSSDSLMAGLACGECSPLAWKILAPLVDAYLAIDDEAAIAAMQLLAAGTGGDIPIVAGESGAAGLAGLQVLLANEYWRDAVGLDQTSRVLLINTEGATSPSIYTELVGEPAAAVLARQRERLGAKR